jgi:hypothetical protein
MLVPLKGRGVANAGRDHDELRRRHQCGTALIW